MIEVFNNFLNKEDSDMVLKYCKTSSYTYGERDSPKTPPCGMVRNISKNENIFKLFYDKIRKQCDRAKELNVYRMYVNCFAPSENPYFHNDKPAELTFLYYVNDGWELNCGGETQFQVKKNELIGVLPIHNSMIKFDSSLTHRARSFRSKHRFTLAVKFI